MPSQRTIPQTCEHCTKPFFVRASRGKRDQRFCSPECFYANRKARRRQDEGSAESWLMNQRVVDPVSGCWLWTGRVNTNGYGAARIKSREALIHRVAMHVWRDFDLDDPRFVCHTCDTRACFNPAHLFVGTAAENAADMVAKGRSAKGGRNGHARLTEAQIPFIRARLASGESQSTVASSLGLNHGTIWHLAAGRTWQHVPLCRRRLAWDLLRIRDAPARASISTRSPECP